MFVASFYDPEQLPLPLEIDWENQPRGYPTIEDVVRSIEFQTNNAPEVQGE